MSVNRRFVVWSFAVPALKIAFTLSALTPIPGAAQSLVASPRVSVMDGDEFALSIGLRGEVGSPGLAAFGQGGVFGLTSRCDTSLPPSCNSPSSGGIELLGGVRLSLPSVGLARPAISLGAGALVWGDTQPYKSGVGTIWEAELRVGVKAFSWSDLLLGVSLRNIGQSVSGGMKLDRDRGTYVGIVAGLLIPATRQ